MILSLPLKDKLPMAIKARQNMDFQFHTKLLLFALTLL